MENNFLFFHVPEKFVAIEKKIKNIDNFPKRRGASDIEKLRKKNERKQTRFKRIKNF